MASFLLRAMPILELRVQVASLQASLRFMSPLLLAAASVARRPSWQPVIGGGLIAAPPGIMRPCHAKVCDELVAPGGVADLWM